MYQGSETYVPLTLFAIERPGHKTPVFPHDTFHVQLVQRGWRAGLLGWTLARWLGAKTVRGIDVTPVSSHQYGLSNSTSVPVSTNQNTEQTLSTNLPERKLEKYEKDIVRFETQQRDTHYVDLPGPKPNRLVPLATLAVRIPAHAGDGYFRLSLRFNHGPYALSPDFRIYSLSLSSASPRGAALVPLRSHPNWCFAP